jgi:hypothetical protein
MGLSFLEMRRRLRQQLVDLIGGHDRNSTVRVREQENIVTGFISEHVADHLGDHDLAFRPYREGGREFALRFLGQRLALGGGFVVGHGLHLQNNRGADLK